MHEISATDAARGFSSLLDAVEHEGDGFTVIRRGKAVARIAPVSRGSGTDVKALLRHRRPDKEWASQLTEVRETIRIDHRT